MTKSKSKKFDQSLTKAQDDGIIIFMLIRGVSALIMSKIDVNDYMLSHAIHQRLFSSTSARQVLSTIRIRVSSFIYMFLSRLIKNVMHRSNLSLG